MKKIFSMFALLLMLFVSVSLMAQPSPPVLIAPPNNATGVSLFPTFDWNDVSGATSYRIQIFTGATTVLDQSGITASQYAIVSAVLAYSTQYYWRVNATGGTGTSNWSQQWYFTTQDAPPGIPTLLSPINGAVNISLTPTLNWNAVPNAGFYRMQVSTDNAFNTTVLDVTGLVNAGYAIQPGVLSNGVQYYWRVNATNTGGTSNWSTVWNFTTILAAPAPPNLLLPVNGAIGVSTQPILDWSDVPGAATYHLQISLNNSFTALALDQSGITVSTYTVGPGILSGTQQYFWRVSSVNVGGEGLWSTVFNFTTTIGAPAAPVLVSPPNNSTGASLTPILDWNNVIGATSYRVQLSLSPSFTTTIVNQVTGANSQYQVFPALNFNTTYYWRANATNAGGTSTWSEVWQFTTMISPPLAPTLLLPVNNATGVSLTPFMDWTDVSGAVTYRLQVATNNTFTNVVYNNVAITTSGFTLPSGYLIGSTQYFWRVAAINSGGQGPYSNPTFSFTTRQTFFLSLKVYLEGFYNGTSQVKDSMKVYLRNPTTPFALRDSSNAIVDSTGNTIISFANATNGSYYIIVKHRNHLETWTAAPMSFSTGNVTTYNFTDNITKAYGSNLKQVGSAFVLYGGDANQDGYVDPTDYTYYKSQFGLSGYKSADFNGDGFVDGYDAPILYNNFGKSYARPF
ncbi:MAG: dockerin type I domain-containing protein [Ignavibacteria bacterium]